MLALLRRRSIESPAFCLPCLPTSNRRTKGANRLVCSTASPTRGSTLLSWNVNSLRSLLRKNPKALIELTQKYSPDVLCLQETKLQKKHEDLFADILEDYPMKIFSSSKTRLGYSGTATFSKTEAMILQREINHEIGDTEGRFIMLEYPGVCVVNVYTMNSGDKLKRIDTRMSWDQAFRKVIHQLRRSGKPVVIVGDLNVAFEDRDVWSAKKAKGVPGFDDRERMSFGDMLETCGMTDAYRMIYPDGKQYTFWEYRSRARERGHGWRIDYALVSNDMLPAVRNVRILDNVVGSDHCPIAIDLAPGML